MTTSIRTLIASNEIPKRPSELLAQIHAHMAVLQNIDTAGIPSVSLEGLVD